MLINEDVSKEALTENCTASKADDENALFNDEEETGNACVDAIKSNCEHMVTNNDNNIYEEELSVEDSDASTLYSNWSDSCSTLESDTTAENKTINTAQEAEATNCATHKWEFSYHTCDNGSKNLAFLSKSKNESEHIKHDKCKVTLPMRLHLNLPNDLNCMQEVKNKSHIDDNCNNNGNKNSNLIKRITHSVELHCVVPSSLHTTHHTSHSQCTTAETKHHRLCVSLHINRALLLSIMQELHCEEEEEKTLLSQIRKSAQSISRNEHLTLVCYYVKKEVESHHNCENTQCNDNETMNNIISNKNIVNECTVHNNSYWHLNAYDVIAHQTNCTCNGITLLPEYRYHIKIEHNKQEDGFANSNTNSCVKPLCIALNKFWSLEFDDTNRSKLNQTCRESCVTSTDAAIIKNAKSTKTDGRKKQETVRINENKKNKKKIDNKGKATELSTPGKRNYKRVRRADAKLCETTSSKRVSQRIKLDTPSTPSPVRRKRSTIYNNNITITTTNNAACGNGFIKRKNGNDNNDMTQFACDANEVLLTEESIVIYTTNIRLSSREMQRCASQHIVLNPPYKYASRARILVAEPPMIRSVKLLSVVPFVTHIVRQSWLKELIKESTTGGVNNSVNLMCNEALLHKHAYMEKRTVLSIEGVNDFSISSLLRTPPQIRQCLFSSFCFWVHPNAKPQELPMNDLKSVIIASGGVLAFDCNDTNHVGEPGTANSAITQEQVMQIQSTNVTFIFVMPSVNVSRTSWRIFINALHTMQTMPHYHHDQPKEHQGISNSDILHVQFIALKRLSSAIFITPDDLFKCVLQQKKPAASTVRNIPFDVQCAMRHATAL